MIYGPRVLLRALSLGLVKDSTITDAKQLPSGDTVEIERSSKPAPLALHVASIYMTCFFGVAILSWLTLLAYEHAPGFAEGASDLTAWLALLAFAFEVHLFALVPAFILRRHPWAWMIHPFLAILTVRDAIMAEGTVRMLRDHPLSRAAVVVMGRAHLPGYERILIDDYGFTHFLDND